MNYFSLVIFKAEGKNFTVLLSVNKFIFSFDINKLTPCIHFLRFQVQLLIEKHFAYLPCREYFQIMCRKVPSITQSIINTRLI